MFKDTIKDIVFKFKKSGKEFSPVFIIGCGRSGTTILGKVLSEHPNIKYLNERRDLWHRSYPEFNIWDQNIKDAKLNLDEKDMFEKKDNILHHLFFREQVLSDADILLEKLPINTFRLDFLKKSFPEARYIYLTRNGLEVSRSISRRIENNTWFLGRKYELLSKYALSNEICFDTNIDSNMEKGMWEWRLSMEKSDSFFSRQSSDKFIHLSYQDFVTSPARSIGDILSFLRLPFHEDWVIDISNDIKRKSLEKITTTQASLYLIGGNILDESINNSYRPSS